MLVTIEKIEAIGVQTRKTVTPKLWRVRVDGKHEGTVGFAPGSKVMLVSSRWTPQEVEEISRQVSELIERPVEVRKPEPVPDEFFKKKEEQTEDDLDLEDFE